MEHTRKKEKSKPSIRIRCEQQWKFIWLPNAIFCKQILIVKNLFSEILCINKIIYFKCFNSVQTIIRWRIKYISWFVIDYSTTLDNKKHTLNFIRQAICYIYIKLRHNYPWKYLNILSLNKIYNFKLFLLYCIYFILYFIICQYLYIFLINKFHLSSQNDRQNLTMCLT